MVGNVEAVIARNIFISHMADHVVVIKVLEITCPIMFITSKITVSIDVRMVFQFAPMVKELLYMTRLLRFFRRP